MMNVDVSVKNQIIGVYVKKKVKRGIPIHVIVSVIKHVKFLSIQIFKIVHAEIVEDEILNTIEVTSIVNKKVTYEEKNNFLILTISLMVKVSK